MNLNQSIDRLWIMTTRGKQASTDNNIEKETKQKYIETDRSIIGMGRGNLVRGRRHTYSARETHLWIALDT